MRCALGLILLLSACATPATAPFDGGRDARVPSPPSAELSPEEARQALLALIRGRPDLFIGRPDPDRLAALPLVDGGDGTYRFGAFVIHPAARWYHAEIGQDELYLYHGIFACRAGHWLAEPPTVSRLHRAPRSITTG